MASRAVGLIQDQNFNLHYNGASVVGKANISKTTVKKGGIVGRKPLSDLSNSVNPAPNHTSKKEKSVSKLTRDSSKKKSVSKTSEKVQAGGRKALSDISNSGKPHIQEISKKNPTSKLTILAEDPKEGFLHNHEECIKAQKRDISTNDFLRTLGLDDFWPASTKEPHMSKKMMPVSPSRNFEAVEMTELLIQDLSPPKRSRKLDAAPPSPEPLDHYMHWNDPTSYKLIESP